MLLWISLWFFFFFEQHITDTINMNFLALSHLDCIILSHASRSGLDPLIGNWASAFKNDRNQIVPKMVKKKTVMFLKSTMRDRGSTTSLVWCFLLIFSSPFVLGGYFFFLRIYLFIPDCVGSSLPHELFSSCSPWAAHCRGFSCWGARALGHAGFSVCSTWLQ